MRIHFLPRLAWSPALALALLAPAWAAAPPPVAVATPTEDVTMFALVPGAVYLNGGIGKDEQQRMEHDARHWPLRLVFSDKPQNEYVAGVHLKVFNHQGQAVLRLKDAGPLTYVQLPQGDYRIDARYKGELLTRSVHIGPEGLETNFHWAL